MFALILPDRNGSRSVSNLPTTCSDFDVTVIVALLRKNVRAVPYYPWFYHVTHIEPLANCWLYLDRAGRTLNRAPSSVPANALTASAFRVLHPFLPGVGR